MQTKDIVITGLSIAAFIGLSLYIKNTLLSSDERNTSNMTVDYETCENRIKKLNQTSIELFRTQ